jgi:hypothetical protein
VLATTLVLLPCCSGASAWNKPDHMVTIAIAYDVLKKEQPETPAKGVAPPILRSATM